MRSHQLRDEFCVTVEGFIKKSYFHLGRTLEKKAQAGLEPEACDGSIESSADLSSRVVPMGCAPAGAPETLPSSE